MQLQEYFVRSAKKNSDKIAIYDQATGKDITYDKMLIASLILAKKFHKYKGKYIGIMVPTSAGCMLSVLGALISGKIPVMINYSTGAYDNCIYAQEKCSFKTIITSKKLCNKINCEHVDGMIYLEQLMPKITITEKLAALFRSKLPTRSLQKSVRNGDENETSVILFTSGSEKEPKAVQLSHKNIGHNLKNTPGWIDVSSEDVFAGTLPLFHVFGLTTNFWLPLYLGCSIVAHANPLDYKAIVESIKKYGITILIGTPTFFYGYLKKAEKGDFDTVRVAIAGADKLGQKLRENFEKIHGVSILEGYGATETSPVVSVNQVENNKPGSIGRPIPGVKVKIVDHETDEELPAGKEGKILVKGDLVMKGYLHDIEETSLHIHNGWYDTGDMGMIDEDGFLWHRGRLKRFVKVGGEMVSLVRVEEILSKFLPDGVQCCVVDVPNPKKGADVVAAVATGEFDKKKLLKQMAKELPAIAVPKEFHVIEDIPLMGSGKVAFRQVEKICRELQNNNNKKKHKH
ncbi:MAG: AMP-binding protein [Candidatus Cloacimonetes bacterium]|nr:AMP-binding protein [Candidatus Cloacimonadota bacterium]MCF7868666.1 AMP-binding protein [Candidatus Cloacimonadota bacterium]